MSYIVKAAAAVAVIDGVDRYYYRGQAITDKPQNAKHLVDAGLIEEVKAPVAAKAEPAKAPEPTPAAKPEPKKA